MSRGDWCGLLAVALGALVGCSAPAEGDDGGTAGNAGNSPGGGMPGGGTAGSAALAGAGGSGGSVSAGGSAGAVTGGGSGGSSGGTVGAGGSGGSACVPLPLTGTSAAKIRTVGYLPTYRGALSALANQLDFAKLSYVDIAFAEVDASGTLSLSDTGICEFTNGAHAAGVKVCAAIGGAATIQDSEGMGKYLPLLAPEGRAAFIANIQSFLAANNFDCIDLDFENPNLGTDYGGFVASLAAALAPEGKEVTAAVGRWFGNPGLTAALSSFAYVNIMAYDMCPFWESTPCEHSTLDETQNEEMAYWLGQGLPADKAVLGVPFYGYRWQGGTGEAITYADIVASYGAAASSDWIESGGATVAFNGLSTIQAKAALAQSSYGGIMIWELMQDAAAPGSLLGAIDGAL